MKFVAENKNENEYKFKFQGQSAISQRWFGLEFDWIKVNFSTHDPDFYKKKFQIHDDTQYTNILRIFKIPIGNSKFVDNFKFHNDAPMLKYRQKFLNIYCFSSLASAFSSMKKIKAFNVISLSIEESLKSKVGNRIDFANANLKNEKKLKGETRVYDILSEYKKKGYHNIPTDISENVTLVKLMDSLGNVNHAIGVVGYWVFDSK